MAGATGAEASVEPYKGFYAVMKEVAGHKKALVVVAVYTKGAQEVVRQFEALERAITARPAPVKQQQAYHVNGTARPAP